MKRFSAPTTSGPETLPRSLLTHSTRSTAPERPQRCVRDIASEQPSPRRVIGRSAAEHAHAHVCSAVKVGHPAMSAQCPVCPKADTARRFEGMCQGTFTPFCLESYTENPVPGGIKKSNILRLRTPG